MGQVTARQGRVNGRDRGIKRASARVDYPLRQAQCCAVLVAKGVTCPERCLVADLLYAVLLIGVFVVLALTLRGLEKL